MCMLQVLILGCVFRSVDMEQFIQALIAGRMKDVPILATLAVIIVSNLLTDTQYGSLEYSSYSFHVVEDDASAHGTTVSL